MNWRSPIGRWATGLGATGLRAGAQLGSEVAGRAARLAALALERGDLDQAWNSTDGWSISRAHAGAAVHTGLLLQKRARPTRPRGCTRRSFGKPGFRRGAVEPRHVMKSLAGRRCPSLLEQGAGSQAGLAQATSSGQELDCRPSRPGPGKAPRAGAFVFPSAGTEYGRPRSAWHGGALPCDARRCAKKRSDRTECEF